MYGCCLRSVFLRSLLFLGVSAASSLAQDQTIYTDSLQNGWMDWGWTAINYDNTSPVHSGSKSISVTITNGWQAIYIAHAAFDSSSYLNISFWMHGGTAGGQQLQIQGHAGGNSQTAFTLTPPTANTWTLYTVSLASIGVANRTDMDGFWIQAINTAQPTFYLDDITLVANPVTPPAVTLTSPTDGAVYTAPATINLSATVTTNSHTINKVGFYNGSTLLVEDTTPPYTATWSSVPAGSYSVIARVTYDGSTTRDSATANITVVSNTPVTITVDAQLNQHTISPLIYGVCGASASQLTDGNFTMNRLGGNEETTYNWQANAHGKGADWYFESYPDSSSTPFASADSFVTDSKNGGAEPMITVSMIGWMPKLGSGRRILWSYSVNKYGPQQYVDPNRTDAGNGLSSTNNDSPITWNNPTDANFPTNSAFEQAYVQHFISNWGKSTNGGVGYYLMDNEETLWHSTHQDIHPVGTTMQEIRTNFLTYAGMVKTLDPNALVCAPEEWGWPGYFYSGYDQQWSGQHSDWNPAHYPDRTANGGWDYCPWLLNQFYQRDTGTGQRLLDYFTLHCYPQEGDVGGSAYRHRYRAAAQPDHARVLGHQLCGPQLDQQHHHVDSPHEELGGHLLPRHQNRRHRIQLGRRGEHQRRHRPGGYPWHFRPRGPRPSHPLDGCGDHGPRPQSHEDVPQLRR